MRFWPVVNPTLAQDDADHEVVAGIDPEGPQLLYVATGRRPMIAVLGFISRAERGSRTTNSDHEKEPVAATVAANPAPGGHHRTVSCGTRPAANRHAVPPIQHAGLPRS
jgi:hypothetical protein